MLVWEGVFCPVVKNTHIFLCFAGLQKVPNPKKFFADNKALLTFVHGRVVVVLFGELYTSLPVNPWN